MFDISRNDIITLTRGDSALLNLVINLGTVADPLIYDLGPQDKLYFGVCEPKVTFEHAIIKKVYTSVDYDAQEHVLTIKFAPEDTEFLLPGVYYYSIKLHRPATTTTAYRPTEENPEILEPYTLTTEEAVDTIINRRKFIIIG